MYVCVRRVCACAWCSGNDASVFSPTSGDHKGRDLDAAPSTNASSSQQHSHSEEHHHSNGGHHHKHQDQPLEQPASLNGVTKPGTTGTDITTVESHSSISEGTRKRDKKAKKVKQDKDKDKKDKKAKKKGDVVDENNAEKEEKKSGDSIDKSGEKGSSTSKPVEHEAFNGNSTGHTHNVQSTATTSVAPATPQSSEHDAGNLNISTNNLTTASSPGSKKEKKKENRKHKKSSSSKRKLKDGDSQRNLQQQEEVEDGTSSVGNKSADSSSGGGGSSRQLRTSNNNSSNPSGEHRQSTPPSSASRSRKMKSKDRLSIGSLTGGGNSSQYSSDGGGGSDSGSSDDENERSAEHQKGKAKPRPLEHKRNLLGQIIYKGHPSWVLMQNLQVGIRHFVGKSAELYDKNQQLSANRVQNIAKEDPTAFYFSPKAKKFPP